MNTTFDFTRYKMIIRQDLISSWKRYLSLVGIMALILSLIFIFCLYKLHFRGNDDESYHVMVNITWVFNVLMICTTAFFVSAAMIFNNMKSKGQRINFLMLPASNVEKYLARLTNAIVITPILLLLSVVIADFVQFIFSLFLAPGHHESVLVAVISRLFEWFESYREKFNHCRVPHIVPDGYALLFFAFSMEVGVHSFLTLGGAFFRKHPILLSGISLFVLMSVIGYAWDIMEPYIQNLTWIDSIMSTYHCVVVGIASFFILLLSAVNYWAAYRLFTRMQVICNKWVNI